ncbi:MAG: hypothetical protein ABIU30_10235 [Ferruginibacter sp.]
MDIFNGNKQLQNLIFSYLDWGLFMASRGTPKGTPSSFLVLKKDDEYDLHQFFGGANAMEESIKILSNKNLVFNQYLISYGIKMKEHELPSIIVLGFDRSEKEGLVFGHSYKINSAGDFLLVGRPFCLGKEGNSLPIIESNSNKDEFCGTASIMTLQDNEKVKFKIPMTYPNESLLADGIFGTVLQLLEQDTEPNFNGKIEFTINPAFQKRNDYLLFLLEQKFDALSQTERFVVWTNQFNNQELNVKLTFGQEVFYECILNKSIIAIRQDEQKRTELADEPLVKNKSKPWWKF